MVKYSVVHYKESKSDWWINGCKLIVFENECVLKRFFKIVAEFAIDDALVVRKIPDQMFCKGINISNGNTSYDLLLYPKTAMQVYHMFNI